MAKARKSSAARRPPEPSDSHAQVEDWIRSVMPDLHPIVQRLDGLIRKTIPGLQYAIKWKKASYGLPDVGWIIETVAYDVSVNVLFFGAADFETPPPLGDTDRSRYVKLATLEEAEGQEMRKWVEQAARLSRAAVRRSRRLDLGPVAAGFAPQRASPADGGTGRVACRADQVASRSAAQWRWLTCAVQSEHTSCSVARSCSVIGTA